MHVSTSIEKVRRLSKDGRLKEALDILGVMDEQGVEAPYEIYLNLLQGCSSRKALSETKRLHAHLLGSGFKSNILLQNALINTYSKCGSVLDACDVFNRMLERDLFTWTTVITGCVNNGHHEEALKLFWLMEKEGLKPDAVTISSILKACANLQTLEQGMKLHSYINKSGFNSDIFVCSTLVDMYAKCGNIEEARLVFDKMQRRNVVAWSAMIAGYVQYGYPEEALKLFGQMVQACVKPNEFTLLSILKACASLGILDQGKLVHLCILESDINPNLLVASTIVDTYSKCGSFEDACQVFDNMSGRSFISWDIMIGAYAQHGLAMGTFQLFQQMQQKGIKVDHVTFVSVLSVCSRAGLVSIGYQCFNSMSRDHGIAETEEHYACMVDLLSRAGQINETLHFIESVPFKPTAVMWMALLSACRMCGGVEVAKKAAGYVLELEPQNDSAFVLLSNTCTELCR